MSPVDTISRRPATKARKPAKRAAAKRTVAAAKRPATSANGSSSSTSATSSSYAERAVLIPVGAALMARDRVVSGVSDTISIYSSTSKTQAQLRKFERRGNTARKRVEREIRKARVGVERELRKRRSDGADLADRLQDRIQSLV
jgi:hypothetical protein